MGNLIDSDKKIVQVEIEVEIEEEEAVGVSLPQVPYFYQFNNTQSPSSTCANTSVAMVLSYFEWPDTPDVLTITMVYHGTISLVWHLCLILRRNISTCPNV